MRKPVLNIGDWPTRDAGERCVWLSGGRSSDGARRSARMRTRAGLSGRNDEALALGGESEPAVEREKRSTVWVTLGPAQSGAQLQGVERSQRMKSQQAGRHRFDRLDVDDDVRHGRE